jgi:hypothetical protein
MGGKRLLNQQLAQLLGFGEDGNRLGNWLQSQYVFPYWNEFDKNFSVKDGSQVPTSSVLLPKAIEHLQDQRLGK